MTDFVVCFIKDARLCVDLGGLTAVSLLPMVQLLLLHHVLSFCCKSTRYTVCHHCVDSVHIMQLHCIAKQTQHRLRCPALQVQSS